MPSPSRLVNVYLMSSLQRGGTRRDEGTEGQSDRGKEVILNLKVQQSQELSDGRGRDVD